MNLLKRLVSISIISGVIFMGVSSANAGILMHDARADKAQNPCATRTEKTIKQDSGIIVLLTSIFGDKIVDAWIGKNDDNVDCGIIVL